MNTPQDPRIAANSATHPDPITGAVMGGLAGKGVAEAIDPTKEDAYWRENFRSRHYVAQGATYDDYGPAYGFGVDAARRHPGRSFDDAEFELSRQWTTRNGASTLGWHQAKNAARDAWDRLQHSG